MFLYEYLSAVRYRTEIQKKRKRARIKHNEDANLHALNVKHKKTTCSKDPIQVMRVQLELSHENQHTPSTDADTRFEDHQVEPSLDGDRQGIYQCARNQ